MCLVHLLQLILYISQLKRNTDNLIIIMNVRIKRLSFKFIRYHIHKIITYIANRISQHNVIWFIKLNYTFLWFKTWYRLNCCIYGQKVLKMGKIRHISIRIFATTSFAKFSAHFNFLHDIFRINLKLNVDLMVVSGIFNWTSESFGGQLFSGIQLKIQYLTLGRNFVSCWFRKFYAKYWKMQKLWI